MTKLNVYKLITYFPLIAFVMLYSCQKDNPVTFSGNYNKGVIIVNQGGFNNGNASISFYDRNSKEIINDVFAKVNQRALGDVAQSIGETTDKYYIVVNNSNKVEVVNKTDFKSVGVINGFDNPRYFVAINDTVGYVTQWGNGGMVKVIDLKSNIIKKSISTANGAETLLKHGNFVFVANQGGFFNTDTVTVINSGTDEVIANIVVGQNPISMVEDKNNKIWVLCGGKWKSDYTGLEIAGSLVRINPSSNSVEQTVNFNSLSAEATSSSLAISSGKDMLSFIYNGSVYSLGVDGSSTDPTLKINRAFYTIGIDLQTGYLYAADPGNYSTGGWVLRYDNNYTKIDSFQVGIGPGYFFFN